MTITVAVDTIPPIPRRMGMEIMTITVTVITTVIVIPTTIIHRRIRPATIPRRIRADITTMITTIMIIMVAITVVTVLVMAMVIAMVMIGTDTVTPMPINGLIPQRTVAAATIHVPMDDMVVLVDMVRVDMVMVDTDMDVRTTTINK
jgi:hypothetical protein